MGTRIDMIGIFVADLSRMVAFYRDVLGFEITWDGSGPYAEFVNEGVRFSMYERAQLPGLLGQTPDYPVGLNGTFELAIDLPTSADADRMYNSDEWRAFVRGRYGCEPTLTYLETPVVVDNIANEIFADS